MTTALGEQVDWRGARVPQHTVLRGNHVLVRALDAGRDSAALYDASHAPNGDPTIWTYLSDGPYASPEQLREALSERARASDPLAFVLCHPRSGEALGTASYMRIVAEHGTIEIGAIWFGPRLRRTTAASESIYLLARHAFEELGYRRLEWKCDALNAASRRAALRFGFHFEGIFEHHQVVKGRNRDTAWFAITEARWPAVRAAFDAWLDPANFDRDGHQIASL